MSYTHMGWLSKITFDWLTPYMTRAGFQNEIYESDIPSLHFSDSCSAIATLTHINTNKVTLESIKDREIHFWDLWQLQYTFHRRQFLQTALLMFVYLIADLCSPWILYYFLDLFNSESTSQITSLLLTAFCLVVVATVRSTTLALAWYYGAKTDYKFHLSTVTKLLSSLLRNKLQVSDLDITSLLSVDAETTAEHFISCRIHWHTWVGAVGCLCSFTGLALLLGKSSLYVILVVLLVVPFSRVVSKQSRHLTHEMSHHRDTRAKLLRQSLPGLVSIRLYGLHDRFQHAINQARTYELHAAEKSNRWYSANSALGSILPMLGTAIAFAAYTIHENRCLTSAQAFACLLWVQMLQFQVTALPHFVAGICRMSVALSRLRRALSVPATTTDNHDFISINSGDSIAVNLINPASPHLQIDPCLLNLSSVQNMSENDKKDGRYVRLPQMKLSGGDLCIIDGPVGCGKTSFLMALSTQIIACSGTSQLSSTIPCASVPHENYIIDDTVRCNILFGQVYITDWFNTVTEACGIENILLDKKAGPRGSELSGGQRARVALARAVYADVSIYLLDEPFVALDKSMAHHIFQNCIINLLLRRNKIVFLVTTNPLSIDIPRMHLTISHIRPKLVKVTSGSSRGLTMYSTTLVATLNRVNGLSDIANKNEPKRKNQSLFELSTNPHPIPQVPVSSIGNTSQTNNDTKYSTRQIWNIFKKLEIHRMLLRTLGAFIAAALLLLAASSWLAHWSNNKRIDNTESILRSCNIQTAFTSAVIYIILVIIAGIALFIRLHFLMQTSLTMSRKLHALLLKSVFCGPLETVVSFTSADLANRFIKDISNVDSSFRSNLAGLLHSLVQIGMVIVPITIISPLALCIPILLGLFYASNARLFRVVAKDMKRIESQARAPLIQLAWEINEGQQIIQELRAYQFIMNRGFRILDRYQRARLFGLAVNQWAVIRFESAANIFVLLALFALIYSRFVGYSQPGAGMAGLITAYLLRLPNSVMWLVRYIVAFEIDLIAVARLWDVLLKIQTSSTHFSDVDICTNLQPISVNGLLLIPQIYIRNLCVSYQSLPLPIFHNVNLSITNGSKVAVIGPTGAGKTSLFNLLLGLLPYDGEVYINGKNIRQFSKHALRQHFSVIFQECPIPPGCCIWDCFVNDSTHTSHTTIFTENDLTVDNSDQSIVHDESNHVDKQQVLFALHKTKLFDRIMYAGSLSHLSGDNLDNAILMHSTENLSQGEKQLLCIAQAIVQDRQIWLADECTSCLDNEIEDMIIDILLKDKHRTVVCILHREQHLQRFDEIVNFENANIKSRRNS